jgi:hypothetical protein
MGGAVKDLFGGGAKMPKPPKPPAPLPPTPTAAEPAVSSAYSDARRRAIAAGARSIQSSSQGITAPADTAKKTLLGA